MEAAGVAVGGVGLARLFSSCLVDRVQSYNSFGTDSQVLETQFRAEKLRFQQRGGHVGFDQETPSPNHHPALDNPETYSAVGDLLQIIETICHQTRLLLGARLVSAPACQ